MRETIALAEKRSGMPSQVPGEMGEAPTGFAPSKDPGYAQIAEAMERLRNAQAAGLPGLTAFNAELGRIGEAYPEVATTIQELMKSAQAGIGLEQAALKARAMSDALQGVATNAQMAAAGLGSIAQFNMNNLQAVEAASALERMANEVDRLADKYPELSIEGAKQVELLNAQLEIAKARTKEEELIAQEKMKTLQLTLQGVSAEEAALRAALERQIVEATNAKQAQQTQRSTNATTAETNKISERDAFLSKVEADNDRRREKEQAEAAQEAAQQAQADAEAHDAAVQRNNAAIEQHNQLLEQAQQLAAGIEDKWANIPGVLVDIEDHLNYIAVITRGIPQFQLWTNPVTGRYEQFNPAGYSLTLGTGSAVDSYMAKQAAMYGMTLDQLKAQQQKPAEPDWLGMQNISTPAAASASLAYALSLGLQNGLSNVTRVIEAVGDKGTQANLVQQAIDYVMSTQPPTLAREEMINQLNSKLESLINSTDSLNSTMQNALSPFYSQDPRTTHLGFRAGVVGNPEWQVGGASNTNPLAAILGAGATAPGMADGGSFMVGGGYSANDNRIAAFPVASGEEVVVNRSRKGNKGGQVIHIDNRTFINGRVDADVFAQMKVSKYQQTQRMRAGWRWPDVNGNRQCPLAGRGRAGRIRRPALQDLDPDRDVGHRAAHC